MPYQGNPGTSKLGKILSDRMAKQNASPLILDFGSIEADYSLKTNTFPVPIPRSDYTVCRHVGGLVLGTTGESMEAITQEMAHIATVYQFRQLSQETEF